MSLLKLMLCVVVVMLGSFVIVCVVVVCLLVFSLYCSGCLLIRLR